MTEFSNDQLLRYARQIVLPAIGGRGQRRLLESRVLVIGAGGLGSPLILYLAAAGVGTIGIVDADAVDLSNLHRQIAHTTVDVGRPKVESASGAAQALNPEVTVQAHRVRIDDGNADAIIRRYDIVADGSDNFPTRDAVHAACLRNRITLVSAAVQGLDAQITTFKAHLGSPHPCLRCLFPEAPAENALPTCEQGGVLGPLAGAIGALQAVEVVKELLDLGESLSGRLQIFDAMSSTWMTMRLNRSAACRAGPCARLRASGQAAEPEGR